MKIHRFLISGDLTPETDVVVRDVGVVHQIKTVLRLRHGAVVSLFDDRGHEGRARLVSVDAGRAVFYVEEMTRKNVDASIAVTMYCAILKRENFEWVAQKATEIGVQALVPCITARTVKQRIVPGRVFAIMREAAEQSGRVTVPKLEETVAFTDALDVALAKHATCVLLDPRGSQINPGPGLAKGAGAIAVFVGPEGGWSEEEYALARAKGLSVFSLGQTVLRGETAAVIGAYLAVRGLMRWSA